MISSITGQNVAGPGLAGLQPVSPVSWRSPSSTDQSATNQSAANSASNANPPPPFDSMMASFLQTHGFTNGQTGATLSSGISDDAQFASSPTTSGTVPSLPNLQSLVATLSDRGASSTAKNSTDASSTSTVSKTASDPNDILTKGLQAVANSIKPNASNTTRLSTGTTAASDNTATSIGSTAQTTLPPWASEWFNVGASTESAATGWADAFGQQNGTQHQYARAVSAYAATSNTNHARPTTNVMA